MHPCQGMIHTGSFHHKMKHRYQQVRHICSWIGLVFSFQVGHMYTTLIELIFECDSLLQHFLLSKKLNSNMSKHDIDLERDTSACKLMNN